jgi:hypothetical protein
VKALAALIEALGGAAFEGGGVWAQHLEQGGVEDLWAWLPLLALEGVVGEERGGVGVCSEA